MAGQRHAARRTRGDTRKRRQGDQETRRQGDRGTRGQRDKETRRQGDRETRRQGERYLNTTRPPLSPGLLVSLSISVARPTFRLRRRDESARFPSAWAATSRSLRLGRDRF